MNAARASDSTLVIPPDPSLRDVGGRPGTGTVAAEVHTRRHRHATRFFWAWLLGATMVSLAGNITHAWLSADEPTRWLAAAVAAVPPAVLLAAVHGVAVLVGAGASGATYRAAVTATAALAAGAFLLSFVALRDLAVMAGIAPGLAVVLPLVIDLAVGVATVALVAIGDKPTPRSATATLLSAAGVPPGMAAPGAAVMRDPATPARAAAATAGDPTATMSAANRAAELVATRVTRQPVETVQAILEAHDRGDALNRIAADLGVHHSAVRRVLDADGAQDRAGPVVARVMAPESGVCR